MEWICKCSCIWQDFLSKATLSSHNHWAVTAVIGQWLWQTQSASLPNDYTCVDDWRSFWGVGVGWGVLFYRLYFVVVAVNVYLCKLNDVMNDIDLELLQTCYERMMYSVIKIKEKYILHNCESTAFVVFICRLLYASLLLSVCLSHSLIPVACCSVRLTAGLVRLSGSFNTELSPERCMTYWHGDVMTLWSTDKGM